VTQCAAAGLAGTSSTLPTSAQADTAIRAGRFISILSDAVGKAAVADEDAWREWPKGWLSRHLRDDGQLMSRKVRPNPALRITLAAYELLVTRVTNAQTPRSENASTVPLNRSGGAAKRRQDQERCLALRNRGWTVYAIAQEMGFSERTVERRMPHRPFKRGFGHHPLWAFVDHGPDGTGEPLAALLRPGNAGSNTAADHITVVRAACANYPATSRGAAPGAGC
jgi:hypothetical protein